MKKIPWQYVSRRIVSLARARELNREHVYAAAMFGYFEEHQWLLWSGMGSNFPRGYKVQTSLRPDMAAPGISQERPEGYEVLRMFLIDHMPFAQVAIKTGFKGSSRQAHRYGKQMLRQYLEKFYELTNMAKMV